MTSEFELDRLEYERTVMDLINYNKRLSTALDDKDKLLKHFMVMCHKQKQQITSLTALQDTAI